MNQNTPSKTLIDIFDTTAARYPDHTAIDFMDHLYTYQELADHVARAARGLQDLGVKKGDRVGLFLPNCPYFVVMYYAILKAGGVVVNFNPLYAEQEVEKQIRNSQCRLMVTLDVPLLFEKLEKVLAKGCFEKMIICRMTAALSGIKKILYPLIKKKDIAVIPDDNRHISFEKLSANDGIYTKITIHPEDDLAVLQYTGGTTGVPKGAMLTHHNVAINTWQSRQIFTDVVEGAERFLGVLPFFHVFAMTTVMNIAISLGAAIIMLPRFDLAQVIKTIHKKRPTLFPAVPTIYTAINHYKDLKKYDLSSIKYCISGGAALPVEVKHDFERLTGCVLVEGYGLSETSPVAACNPVKGTNKVASIGLPVPQTKIEIISLEDRQSLMPLGERGEVCITGPQVMKGYWDNAEETAAALDETSGGRRLHTGDVGYQDAEGYTFIVDRIKDMIAAGGFKVYPRHVEEAIYQHDAVEECCVIGVPDEYRGQTVKAFIKIRAEKTLSTDELLVFLKDKLSPIEMPKQVEFRDALPKTLIGKLSKKELIEEERLKAAKKTKEA
jgi:long-chain acyl-CoA synthetase